MITTFTLVQELLTLMRSRERNSWATEEEKMRHYQTWERTLKLAHAHQAAESDKDVVQTLVRAMEMQDKRESGEFHLTTKTARHLWDQDKLVGEAYLIRMSAARFGYPPAGSTFAEQFPTAESRTDPSPATVVTSEEAPPKTKKVITEATSEAETYLKQRAETMGRALKKMGVPLKHGQLLKVLAVAEGYKGFSALKLALIRNAPGFCPHCGAAGTVHEVASVYCEQGQYDGRRYEAEGEGAQYACTRCEGQFTDWCGIATGATSGSDTPSS